MAVKKAAKKVAKKAAKNVAGKHDPHKSANDARRTFEHLGRVQALSNLTSTESEALNILTKTADTAFRTHQYKESADILRAAEHLSFATLHAGATETVATELKGVIQKEFEHLVERSEEHASRQPVPRQLQQLLTRLSKDASAAMKRGSYRAALEFARGAEALSHVHELGDKTLGPASAQKRLQD